MQAVDFQLVLGELERRKATREAEFKAEMEGIDEAIRGLRKMLVQEVGGSNGHPKDENYPLPGDFNGMSVRWAVLKLLSQNPGPLKTAAIAEMLQKGGITSGGANFTSNVSAVISVMVNDKKELEKSDDGEGYQLTGNGRSAWDVIQRSYKYLHRGSPTV